MTTALSNEAHFASVATERVVGWWESAPQEHKPLVRSDVFNLSILALQESGFAAGPMHVLDKTINDSLNKIDSRTLVGVLNEIADERIMRGEA